MDARIYLNDFHQFEKYTNFSDPLAAVVTATGLALSSTVNTLVTGLIVFKIIKVYRETSPNTDKQSSSADGGNKLRPVIFVLVESGIALCSIQLIRLVFCLVWTDTITKLYQPLICIQQMLTVRSVTIVTSYLTYNMVPEHDTYDYPCAGFNGIVFPRYLRGIYGDQRSALRAQASKFNFGLGGYH